MDLAVADIPSKRCNTCGLMKPLDAYSGRRGRPPEWRNPRCKSCMAKAMHGVNLDPTRSHHKLKPTLTALAGVRIHAGVGVDTSHTLTPIEQLVTAPPDTTGAALPGLEIRPGTITCRQWLLSDSPHKRLFVCQNGRFVIEQSPASPSSSSRFLLWHRPNELRKAEIAPCEVRIFIMILSLVASEVLDAPGVIFSM